MTSTVTRATPPPHHLAAVVTGPHRIGSVYRTDRVFSSKGNQPRTSRCCCWKIPSAFASPLESSVGWAEAAWSAAVPKG